MFRKWIELLSRSQTQTIQRQGVASVKQPSAPAKAAPEASRTAPLPTTQLSEVAVSAAPSKSKKKNKSKASKSSAPDQAENPTQFSDEPVSALLSVINANPSRDAGTGE